MSLYTHSKSTCSMHNFVLESWLSWFSNVRNTALSSIARKEVGKKSWTQASQTWVIWALDGSSGTAQSQSASFHTWVPTPFSVFMYCASLTYHDPDKSVQRDRRDWKGPESGFLCRLKTCAGSDDERLYRRIAGSAGTSIPLLVPVPAGSVDRGSSYRSYGRLFLYVCVCVVSKRGF